MRACLLLLVCACGRIGFDLGAGNIDGDSGTPFVEAAGQLDATFGSSGLTIVAIGNSDTEPYQVVERTGGGYFTVGVHRAATSVYIGVFAFTQGGVLDIAYGSNGIADIGPTGNDFGYGALRLADGRTAIVGDGDDKLGDQDNITVGMLDTAGVPDPAFGSGGFRRIDVEGLQRGDTSAAVVYDGSHLVVCGTTDYDATDSHLVLAELGLDGTPAAGFGTAGVMVDDFSAGGTDECTSVVATANGRIVVSARSGSRARLAAYHADGTRDVGFGSGGVVTLVDASSGGFGVAMAPDSDLVACGDNAGQGLLARVSADGVPRTSFGNGGLVMPSGISIIWRVVVQPNGKIVATGQTISDRAGVVMRFMPDGTLDADFGDGGIVMLPAGGPTTLLGLLVEADGAIVTAGYVEGGADRGVIARIR